ncbi:chlorhexidine efflux transporter, partial [Candidatus Thioglobus sp.]
MALRTTQDRVRHAVLFELIGLAIMVPVGAYLFQLPVGHMGVLGVVGA